MTAAPEDAPSGPFFAIDREAGRYVVEMRLPLAGRLAAIGTYETHGDALAAATAAAEARGSRVEDRTGSA